MMLSDVCLCVCLSVWYLSVAYIGPKSRTERPRKTKIGTDVAHVTRDSDTTFKVKRPPGRFTHRGVNTSCSCSDERGNVISVGTYWAWEPTATFPSAGAVGSAARGTSAPTEGGEGRSILWRPPAYSLYFSAILCLCHCLWIKGKFFFCTKAETSRNIVLGGICKLYYNGLLVIETCIHLLDLDIQSEC